MGSGIKFLIAASSLAVIASAGYDIYMKRKYDNQEELVASVVACKQRVKDMSELRLQGDDPKVISKCMLKGFITSRDVDEAIIKIRSGG